MIHLTAPRAALASLVPAFMAGVIAGNPLLGFYLTAIAAAGLIGAAFLAYLEAVDRTRPLELYELGAIALAALVMMLEVAIRFPRALSAGSEGVSTLVLLSGLLVISAVVAEQLARHGPHLHRPSLTPLRELISR